MQYCVFINLCQIVEWNCILLEPAKSDCQEGTDHSNKEWFGEPNSFYTRFIINWFPFYATMFYIIIIMLLITLQEIFKNCCEVVVYFKHWRTWMLLLSKDELQYYSTHYFTASEFSDNNYWQLGGESEYW